MRKPVDTNSTNCHEAGENQFVRICEIRVSHPYYNVEGSRILDKDLECGDLSPLSRLADLSARQSRVQRLGAVAHPDRFDGDKSPAQSADKSAHSKPNACGIAAPGGSGSIRG
jgi:hypothetical protein